MQGDYKRALADYDQAIELDPKNAVTYNNRGNVYYAQGDYKRALADYDQAIELDPKYELAHTASAKVYAKLAKLGQQ